jgi:hypothetical protein
MGSDYLKYVVDKIEDNIVVLENVKTKDIKYIHTNDINFKVEESDVLIYENKNYIKDNKAKKDRLKIIQDKLTNVKKI